MTLSLLAYVTGDSLIEGGMNILDGYMKNGKGATNQSSMVSTPIVYTAGFPSNIRNIEPIGDGGTMMPGVVG